jgi:hypothetical protein
MLPLGREWHFVPQKHRKILREKSKLEYGTKSLAKHKQSMMLGLLEFGLNNHDVIWPYFPKILLGFFFFFLWFGILQGSTGSKFRRRKPTFVAYYGINLGNLYVVEKPSKNRASM